jgi:hypothetical protein
MHSREIASPVTRRVRDEQGVALIISLMALLLMSALGLALMMNTTTETKIAGNFREGHEAMYAADAAVERVMQDLLTVPDWNKVLDGSTTSSFIDGQPFGQRDMGNGQTLDLTEATNMLRCGKTTTCSDADMNALTDERPWGLNNPRWQPYAYGPITDMIPTGTVNSMMYVVVWVADDPAENDNDPVKDGGDPAYTDPDGNLGKGVMSLIAHAYGPGGVRKVIEVTVGRTDTSEMERGYTGQRGQDEQNRRARKQAVQTPGKALTSKTMTIGGTSGFQQ